MIKPLTFHKTVTGHSHLIKNPPVPCEDFSSSYSDSKGRYHICVISDGHGDTSCFRSSYGSKAVVKAVLSSAKAFAEGILKENAFDSFLRSPIEQKRRIKTLTDSIVASWQSDIMAELKANPPTEEEFSKVRDSVLAKYKRGEHLAHIYGATLIAGILIDNRCLVLLQQGDGRCNVFYEDGSVDQPIPWDDRCYENVTTSMCDLDTAYAIRHCVIDTKQKGILACYVGSDGVEDSYGDSVTDMAGNYNFYKNITCEVIDRHADRDNLDSYLGETFSALSKTGSADDVSVSGIVDIEGMKKHYPAFRNASQAYSLNSTYLFFKKKVDSMQMKHDYLIDAVEKAEKELQTKKQNLANRTAETEALKAKLTALIEDRDNLYREIEAKKLEADTIIRQGQQQLSSISLDEPDNDDSPEQPLNSLEAVQSNQLPTIEMTDIYSHSSDKPKRTKNNFTDHISRLRGKLSSTFSEFFEEIKSVITSDELRLKKLCFDISALEKKIKAYTEGLTMLSQNISDAEEKLIKLTEERDTYDASYLDFAKKRDETAAKIIQLGGTLPS